MARPKTNVSGIKYPSSRVLHAVIFMADKEGKLLMDLETLQDIIADHEGGYLSYAFILHDKDVYDAEAVYQNKELNHKTYIERLKILSAVKDLPADELQESGYVFDEALAKQAQDYADEQFPEIVKGQEKPTHWHVVFNFSSSRRVDEIARWFKLKNGNTLEPNWVAVKTGRGALENAYNYLVHKNDKLKYQYEADEVVASFDYIEHLKEAIRKDERAQKYNVAKNDINELIDKVSIGELTVSDVKKILPFAVYQPREKAFMSARQHYVRELMPMPVWREVFYVDADGIDENTGAGGVGKSTIARAYAKQLAARCGANQSLAFDELRDYIFVAGSKDVFLDNYDGQPVLFIDEITADDLVSACRGISTVKQLLDPYPVRTNMNVKFSSLVCTAKYIIINGIQSLMKFKNDLSKFDKAPEQIDRRILAGIHLVNATDLELWVNRGLFDNMPDMLNQIKVIARARHSIAQIASDFDGEARFIAEGKVLRPLLAFVDDKENQQKENPKISNSEELEKSDLFKQIGEIIIDDDFKDADDEIIEIFDDKKKHKMRQNVLMGNKLTDLVNLMFVRSMYNFDDEELYLEFTKVAVEVIKGQEKTMHNKEYFELAKKVYSDMI